MERERKSYAYRLYALRILSPGVERERGVEEERVGSVPPYRTSLALRLCNPIIRRPTQQRGAIFMGTKTGDVMQMMWMYSVGAILVGFAAGCIGFGGEGDRQGPGEQYKDS